MNISQSRRFVTASLVGAAFIVGLGVAVALRPAGEGRAEELPGTVRQSSTVVSNGVSIRLEKAVFSSLATDVWLQIALEDSGQQPGGLEPSAATLNASKATSAVASDDGSVVLRFPSLVKLSGAGTTTLQIQSVDVFDRDGASHRVSGRWDLDLRLASNDDEDAISRLEALQPAVLEIDGNRAIIEAFRTSAWTVVRYRMPSTVVETGRPPSIVMGTNALNPTRSQQNGREQEIWYESTPSGVPLTLLFTGLLVSGQDTKDSTLEFRLGALEAPIEGGPDQDVEARPIAWQREDEADISVVSIVRHRDPSGSTIRIVVGGLWNPQLGGKPQVFADGQELFVRGVGNRPATSDGPQTDVEADLPEGITPQSLIVRLLGGPSKEVGAEVTLQP